MEPGRNASAYRCEGQLPNMGAILSKVRDAQVLQSLVNRCFSEKSSKLG